MLAGLGTRWMADDLPDFVSSHFGDALWAGMIYCAFRTVAVNKRLEWALLVSFLFCFAIEFSQLYQADWINTIRRTVPGGLILGHGFLFVDLVRNSAGIIIIYAADRLLTCLRRKN